MKINYYLNDDINCYYCLNLYIMVITRGLRRALGGVLGKDLGRHVSGDAKEAIQH